MTLLVFYKRIIDIGNGGFYPARVCTGATLPGIQSFYPTGIINLDLLPREEKKSVRSREMINKSAGGKDQSRNLILVSIYLLALTFFLRLPYFFNILIDWDESTFILIGQSLLEGHLPYTELWDIKPPLLFVPYAAAIACMGKSIVSVRILGALFVTLTGILTYLIGRKLLDRRTGLLSATLTVIAIGSIRSGQAVMAEHIALVPLVGAICVLILRQFSPTTLFLTGVLLGVATFCRLNLAYVAVGTGFFIFVISFLETPRFIMRSVRNTLAYAAGGFTVVILILLPYALNGLQKLWWDSAIVTPLIYSGAQQSFAEALIEHATYILQLLSNPLSPFFGVNAVVWPGGAAGVAAIIFRWSKASKTQKRDLAILLTFLFSTLLSILKGGATWPHYLIQLIPFMALAAGFLLKAWSQIPSVKIAHFVVLLVCTVSMLSPVKEYERIGSRLNAGLPPTHGAAYAIADYLKQHNVPGRPIYMMTDHIVYWLMGTKPPMRIASHPSNISRECFMDIAVGPGATTVSTLSDMLALKPSYIVKKRFVRYLRKNIHAMVLLDQTLRTHYACVGYVEGRLIYRRLD